MFEDLINDAVSKYSNGQWQGALILSASIIFGALLLHLITFASLRSLSKKRADPLLNQIQQSLRIPSLVLLLTISLHVILFALLPENRLVGIGMHLLKLCIIFSVSWLIISLIKLGRGIVLKHYHLEEKDNLKARRVYTQYKIMERILIFLVVLIAMAVALMTFEQIRRIGLSLFASAGVAGIILGFAAQKLIANVLAGFQIAISQPIRIEDVVIVENEWGWIEEINLTYVVVRIWDKRRLIVPTTYFIEKPFQNWTRTSAEILGSVYLYTDYTVPLGTLREELTRILESDQNWDGKVNVLQVTNSTDKTMEIRALMSAADSPSAWDLRVNVREKLIDFLQKNYPENLPRSRVDLTRADAQ